MSESLLGKARSGDDCYSLLPRKRPVIEGTIVDARDRDSRRWLVIIVDTNECWGFWAGRCRNCWNVAGSLALMGVNEDMAQTCRTESITT